jgi:hypothetical protein
VSEVAMPYPVADGRMNPAQALGSLLTYGRRYSYGAALGLPIEDDDDARSQHEAPKHAPAKPEAPKEKLFSEELKDAFEAGQITAAEREDLHSRAAKTNTAAIAVGGKPDFSALRAELARKTGPKAPAKAEEPDIY